MITIGYSTRNSNPEFQEYLKKSSGHPKVQVIEKVNNGEKNLSQVYNEIISESNFDIIVLCHDDIYFDTSNWASKLVKQFDRNSDYGCPVNFIVHIQNRPFLRGIFLAFHFLPFIQHPDGNQKKPQDQKRRRNNESE